MRALRSKDKLTTPILQIECYSYRLTSCKKLALIRKLLLQMPDFNQHRIAEELRYYVGINALI